MGFFLQTNPRNFVQGPAQNIGLGPITQLHMCVIKIVTFKGGHPMW